MLLEEAGVLELTRLEEDIFELLLEIDAEDEDDADGLPLDAADDEDADEVPDEDEEIALDADVDVGVDEGAEDDAEDEVVAAVVEAVVLAGAAAADDSSAETEAGSAHVFAPAELQRLIARLVAAARSEPLQLLAKQSPTSPCH